MSKTDALIMAAGSSERFGGAESKQFTRLHGRAILCWALEPFVSLPAIDRITIVVAPDEEKKVLELVEREGYGKVRAVVPGGTTRQESVWFGLRGVDEDSDYVLIHDAARPCVSAGLVSRMLEALIGCDAVVPVLPAVDTLVHEMNGQVDALLDRVHISTVQTPQAFRTRLIRTAHRRAHARGFTSSDDGSLVYAMNEQVSTIEGERTNIKVTFADDIAVAEAILSAQHRA